MALDSKNLLKLVPVLREAHGIYQDITSDSFQEEVYRQLLTEKPNVRGLEDRTFGEILEEYGLTDKFRAYLKDNLFSGWKGRVVRAMQTAERLEGLVSKATELVELGATGAAAAAGGAAGAGAAQTGSAGLELAIYGGLADIKNKLGALGFAVGAYEPNLRGVWNYCIDNAWDTAGAMVKAIPVVGTIASLTNLDIKMGDRRPRIKEAASRIRDYWLAKELNIEGVKKPETLIDKISSWYGKNPNEVKANAARADAGEVVDYDVLLKRRAGTPDLGSADYGEDLFSRAA
jgi:hypothetical protein